MVDDVLNARMNESNLTAVRFQVSLSFIDSKWLYRIQYMGQLVALELYFQNTIAKLLSYSILEIPTTWSIYQWVNRLRITQLCFSWTIHNGVLTPGYPWLCATWCFHCPTHLCIPQCSASYNYLRAYDMTTLHPSSTRCVPKWTLFWQLTVAFHM